MAFVIANLVKETTTTVGTGPLTLDGAMVGHRPFSAKCAIGDTFFYSLRAVDAAGAPTGEFEHGLGTYSAPNTITRTTVDDSSNTGAVVNLSAGTKQVYISMPAAQVAWARERLTAARTYYVATTGSDTNNGLTSGTAFLTIQKAMTVVANLDCSDHQLTVQLADVAWTTPVTLPRTLSSLRPILQGNTATPANCTFQVASNDCIKTDIGAHWHVQGVKLTTTVSGSGLAAGSNATVANANGAVSSITFSNVDFGACASYHILATSAACVVALGNYSISGSAQFHAVSTSLGKIDITGRTVTLTGTPAFTSFAYSRTCGILECYLAVFSGGATGSYYNCSLNGVIFRNGTNLPGNAAGTTTTGGQYA